MKTFRLLLAAFALLAPSARASESMLTTTYQPLMTFPDADIVVMPVLCHQWYASSAAHSMDLIHVPNIPPTDNPERAKADLNLASVCGVKFSHSDPGVGDYSLLLIDLTGFSMEESGEFTKVAAVRACLECLRLCTRGGSFAKTPLTFKCGDGDREWVSKLVDEFNARDRERPFFATVHGSLHGSDPGEPAQAAKPVWTHRATAGDEGKPGSYFYFETTGPASGEGVVTAVTRVRAIDVLPGEGPVPVVDYAIGRDGIRVRVLQADRKDFDALITGKDIEFKIVDEFGPADKKALTDSQKECVDRLITILAMPRNPLH